MVDPLGIDWVRTMKSPRPVSVAAWWRMARRGRIWWPGKTFTVDLKEHGDEFDAMPANAWFECSECGCTIEGWASLDAEPDSSNGPERLACVDCQEAGYD